MPVAILMMMILLGCKKDKVVIDFNFDYVPIQSGLTLIYDVRDIFHDEALVPANDTNYYQIKTVVGESFIDDLNDTVYKLRRFIRQDPTEVWQIKDVWTIQNNGNRIELVEENLRLIDFVFPPSLNQRWDINALNNQDEKESQFLQVNVPFSINNFAFDSTCMVSHQDFLSLVDYNLEQDVFAKGIGKVYSNLKELTINNFDTLDIKKGIELEYRLIDYSK